MRDGLKLHASTPRLFLARSDFSAHITRGLGTASLINMSLRRIAWAASNSTIDLTSDGNTFTVASYDPITDFHHL
jgi:hypothetical protein